MKKSPLSSSLGSIALLFSMWMVAAFPLKGAIVDNGNFQQGISVDPIPNAPLTNWAPTNSDASPSPATQVIGQDPTLSYGTAASPISGSIAVTFSSNPATPPKTMASISQTLTTVAAQTYNLQLWVANPLGDLNSRGNLFSVIWNGAPVNLTLWNANFASPEDPNNPLRQFPLTAELYDPADPLNTAGTYVIGGGIPWFKVDITVTALGTSSTLKISGQNNNNVTLVDDVSVVETPEPSTMVLLVAGVALIGSRRRRQQAAA